MSEREQIRFSSGLLKDALDERRIKPEEFAGKIGLSLVAFQRRLRGEVAWTQTDIYRACKVLNIDDGEKLKALFFTPKM